MNSFAQYQHWVKSTTPSQAYYAFQARKNEVIKAKTINDMWSALEGLEGRMFDFFDYPQSAKDKQLILAGRIFAGIKLGEDISDDLSDWLYYWERRIDSAE